MAERDMGRGKYTYSVSMLWFLPHGTTKPCFLVNKRKCPARCQKRWWKRTRTDVIIRRVRILPQLFFFLVLSSQQSWVGHKKDAIGRSCKLRERHQVQNHRLCHHPWDLLQFQQTTIVQHIYILMLYIIQIHTLINRITSATLVFR